MPEIILFSGMDFSGKSTTIKQIMELHPGEYLYSDKFLTQIKTLHYMIQNDIWIPPKESFIPLLIQLTKKDLSNLDTIQTQKILQDTIWVIKFIARLKTINSTAYATEIEQLTVLVNNYPHCESYYFIASLEERLRRYTKRQAEGKRLSKSDQLIFNPYLFEKIDSEYKNLIFEIFPNTKIIDTTYDTPAQIAHKIIDR